MAPQKRAKHNRSGPDSRYVLANQILDIVRDRRLEKDERLAEVALAEQLGVSRTPVRAALKLLAREGIVLARPNQGFSLQKGWTELKSTILAAPSSSEDELYLKIIGGRLDGTIPKSVTQASLLEQFDVSRAVLLRTLSRMAEEGLVTKNKGRGWTFLPAIDTAVALRNSYDFRLVVEPAVFELETFEINMVALDRARSRHLWLLEQGDDLNATSQQLFEVDAQFHEMIMGFANNSFFLQVVQHQNRLRRLLEYQGYWDLRRVRTWVSEHLEILDALYAQDLKKAAERMRKHLGNAYSAAVKLGVAKGSESAGRKGERRPARRSVKTQQAVAGGRT
ncbi:GntR family transcriptional regulator [Afifella pfennigii]|uniref:GntR family transcriptional regulator n=1 Tax=Afifella pfennigii TaxID=209897 RepID=UPI0009FE26B7|nr:GntR family transcriptional regulator [Afifella pfennigii]